MKSPFLARVWTLAAPAMLGPAVVLMLGPHTIFTTNLDEFAVAFGDLAVPWLLRAAAMNWLILLGVGCGIALWSERLTRMYAALLLAFGLLLWAQGNLWNADYGVLTGDDIDLVDHAWRAPYELAAWATGLLLAVAFFRRVSPIAPFAAIAFMSVQLAATASVAGEGEAASGGRWVDPPPAIYQFSATRNVVHVVLDAFQSDVFADILRQDRAAFDREFAGFEYFVDHAGAFPTTAFSMVAMLTGEEYRNQGPAPEFAREAFRRSSIFEKVSRAGYDIDAMSIVPVASLEEWLGPEAHPNWQGARFQIRRPFVSRQEYSEVTARQLLELSLFRHAPHAVKAAMIERPDAFYGAAWIDRRESPAQMRQYQASNSAAFFEHFTHAMTAGRTRPVYKLLHVGVPHRPIVVDRECRFIGVSRVSRQTYTEQSRCAVRRVTAFLDRLRELGIYDSSVIIISSDHGTGLQPSGFTGRSDSLPLSRGASTERLATIAGTARALMLIKPPNRSGPLAISEAPTSHVDLQPTILDLIGLPGGVPGESMFRRDPKRPRARSFGMYDLRERFPKAYFNRLDALAIDGPVVDAAGWRLRQSIWRPDVRLDTREVDIGTRAGAAYLGPGWSAQQHESVGRTGNVTFVRALTQQAVLFASLPSGASDVVLRAASPANRAPRSVRVDLDGRSTARLSLPADAGYRDLLIKVPADAERPSISQMTLQFETDSPDGFVFKLDRMLIH